MPTVSTLKATTQTRSRSLHRSLPLAPPTAWPGSSVGFITGREHVEEQLVTSRPPPIGQPRTSKNDRKHKRTRVKTHTPTTGGCSASASAAASHHPTPRDGASASVGSEG